MFPEVCSLSALMVAGQDYCSPNGKIHEPSEVCDLQKAFLQVVPVVWQVEEKLPGKPVAQDVWPLRLNSGLLRGMVVRCFGLLGIPGAPMREVPLDAPTASCSNPYCLYLNQLSLSLVSCILSVILGNNLEYCCTED